MFLKLQHADGSGLANPDSDSRIGLYVLHFWKVLRVARSEGLVLFNSLSVVLSAGTEVVAWRRPCARFQGLGLKVAHHTSAYISPVQS